MAVDLRYADVKCADCGKEYTCTPETDYFHPAGFPDEKTTENGYCWDCFMRFSSMPLQPEPPYIDG